MKYSFNCQKCKSKEVYEPRKELPKDPHTRCTQCGHHNHFKSGDLKELKSKVTQQKRKSIQPVTVIKQSKSKEKFTWSGRKKNSCKCLHSDGICSQTLF